MVLKLQNTARLLEIGLRWGPETCISNVIPGVVCACAGIYLTLFSILLIFLWDKENP